MLQILLVHDCSCEQIVSPIKQADCSQQEHQLVVYFRWSVQARWKLDCHNAIWVHGAWRRGCVKESIYEL